MSSIPQQDSPFRICTICTEDIHHAWTLSCESRHKVHKQCFELLYQFSGVQSKCPTCREWVNACHFDHDYSKMACIVAKKVLAIPTQQHIVHEDPLSKLGNKPLVAKGEDFLHGRNGVNRSYEGAVRCFRIAATRGDAKGQHLLADCYRKGHGIDKDFALALTWYQRAAEQGVEEAARWTAMLSLSAQELAARGDDYYYGRNGCLREYSKSARIFTLGADRGWPHCQAELGWMYENGFGVPQSAERAVALYQQSADQGCRNGQYYLGNMYFTGLGVAQDHERARELYLAAAQQSDSTAQFALAEMHRKGEGGAVDYTLALKWYMASAEKGQKKAQHWIDLLMLSDAELLAKGDDYYFGRNGCEKDYVKSVECFTLGADRGWPRCQAELGWMHENRLGVPKDTERAVALYRQSADQGCRVGQRYLGKMYFVGRGVAQNYKRARELYLAAAQQSDSTAQFALAEMHRKGQGGAVDDTLALKWYMAAAELGSKAAQEWVEELERVKHVQVHILAPPSPVQPAEELTEVGHRCCVIM